MEQLETSIAQVTVYPDRARVTRRGATRLAPGRHAVLIADLPLGLEPDSVRAAGRGRDEAQASLLGVSVDKTIYRESPAEQVRQLEQAIESLEDKQATLQDEQATLTTQLTHLDGLAGQTEVFARGLALGRTQIKDQAGLLDYLSEQATRLRAALQESKVAQREQTKTLTKLRQELEQLRSARPRQRYAATIEVLVTQAGECEFDLTYTLGNASWEPLYDLRLTESDREDAAPRLELTYLGQVQQSTGEDWTDVELVLSTARPALGGALPELKPWYLDVYRPRPPAPHAKTFALQAAAPAMAGLTTGAEPEAEPASAIWEELAAATATVEASGAAVTFHLPGRATIPSDGEPHKTTIASYALEPELDYVTAPRLVDAVYRRAQVTNTSPAILLPGRANVFVSQEYIGSTELEHVAPSESFELALGVDDRVKVKHEMVVREVDKSLVGDKRRLRYGYKIELENLRPVQERIVIRDHYPLARHEQIKVKLESAEPEPKPIEMGELHLLEWELPVAAGQKQVIRYAFAVEHPRSLTVTGLTD